MAILIPNFELAKQIGKRIEIDAETVDELLRKGANQYGEAFRKASAAATISVNGVPIRALKRGKTPLHKDDAVWFVLPSGGG